MKNLFALLSTILFAAAVLAHEPVTPPVYDDALMFDPAHTPAGVKPIVVWLNGTTLETVACFIDDTNPDAITCTPPAAVGQSQILCESTGAGTGGADCAGWQVPADVDTGDYVYDLDSKGRIPGHGVMPAIGWIRLSGDHDCITPDPDECDSNDHIQFNAVVLETDTATIDCDVATAYTKTTDVASIGRCQIKAAGTYLVESGLGFDFNAATDYAYVAVRDSTNTQQADNFPVYPWSGTTVTNVMQRTGNHGSLSFTSGEVPAWVDVFFQVSIPAAGVTKVLAGAYFKVTRLY